MRDSLSSDEGRAERVGVPLYKCLIVHALTKHGGASYSSLNLRAMCNAYLETCAPSLDKIYFTL